MVVYTLVARSPTGLVSCDDFSCDSDRFLVLTLAVILNPHANRVASGDQKSCADVFDLDVGGGGQIETTEHFMLQNASTRALKA